VGGNNMDVGLYSNMNEDEWKEYLEVLDSGYEGWVKFSFGKVYVSQQRYSSFACLDWTIFKKEN
jgi:hypothetical protein